MRARAAISDGTGDFVVGTIEVAEPGPGEVLVEVKASGVCHTDQDSLRWGFPVVMGHEGAGVVRAVGPGVGAAAPGERVLLNWAVPCGRCFQCLRGAQNICEQQSPVVAGQGGPGAARPEGTLHGGVPIRRAFNLGTMSTLALVREAAVVRIDVEIPFASACIVGCGVMTGYGSVVNAARVRPGSSVAVLGTGGVGLSVVQAARIAGASMIVGVDVNSARLEMARRFGATHTVPAERSDTGLLRAAEEIRRLTGGRGADYAFECTAVPELGAAPLAMVRNGGTAVQVSGVEQEIRVDMNLFEWDKTYINPLYGQCRPQIDLPALLGLYAKGDLKLDEMITRTYALDQLDRALDDMLAGRNAKGVLLME
jgi:S-(hydroxymethyl)glutathione dehydrogenase/alcohol dehydrogenase